MKLRNVTPSTVKAGVHVVSFSVRLTQVEITDFIVDLIAHECVKLANLQVEDTYVCAFLTLAVGVL